jgi:hypothetical protein
VKINNVISVSEFVTEIEELVENNDMDYMDACVLYAETKSIEIETVASLVKQSLLLKQKVQAEGESANMLKKVAKAK